MLYVSTRGRAKPIGFADVLLAGPAPDGGLYLPGDWPHWSEADIAGLSGCSYADVAFRIIRPFVGGAMGDAELKTDIDAAYATFSTKEVAPLAEIGKDRYLLELFHGPTLAFKDVALQLLGRLFARELGKRKTRATIVVATSGDTGSAAIAAFKGRPHIDIVVLHPKGRVSDVQRRQMTTASEPNVHSVAIEGTFDDTQNIVKALFADDAFARDHHLGAVNSINFARIVAQCVYYFTAALALKRPPVFVVPTGNFGDVFAGEAAHRMGLSIERLIVATNENDILPRAFESGVYQSGAARPTLSPSMDIQVASNFERALFEGANRDGAWVAGAMAGFAQDKRLTIPPAVLTNLRALYAAGRADDEATVAAIAEVYRQSGKIIDPHTAVGIAVADAMAAPPAGTPLVFLATADPAKFPDAIRRAIGKRPELPPALADLMDRKERYDVLPHEARAVRRLIEERITP